MQRVGLVTDHDRVAGVVAALVADHVVDAVAEKVGGLALALVSPWGTRQNDGRHRASPFRSGAREYGGGLRARVGKELLASPRLIILADAGGRPAEQVQRTQEAAVRLVLPGDRAVTSPSGPAQQVEPAVIAGAGVGVCGDNLPVAHRPLGERCPDRGKPREPGGDVRRVVAGPQRRPRRQIVGQQRRRRARQQVVMLHWVCAFDLSRQPSRWPADSRSSHACATRAAIPASAALPYERGSYSFFLPTSPSTFSTPS